MNLHYNIDSGGVTVNRLVISTYACNYEKYEFFYEIMEGIKDYNAGIEITLFDDQKFLNDMNAQKQRLNTFYTTFHGAFGGLDFTADEGSDAFNHTVDVYRDTYELAKAYDAKSIVYHTHRTKVPPEAKKDLMEKAYRTMNVIGDMAVEAGQLLLVENVGLTVSDNVLFNEDEFLEIFKNINPGVGCLIDVGHAMINRWDINRVIRTLGDRIKGYHLHNTCGMKDSHRPLFEAGNIYDHAKVVDMLKCMEECSPKADWIIEYAPIDEMSPELMKREVEELMKYAK